ncbi:MAG: hypothetical protein ACRD2W_15760 [Acidimicrobiales bacterium]
MNSNAIAFGIPGLLVCIAALLWLRPRFSRRRKVRRFRKDLAHVDLMAIAWSQAMREHRPFDDGLHSHRPRRRKSREPEGDVPA